MRLLFQIDTKDYNPNGTVCFRPSVRAIIIENGKVAMVHSEKYNYYKLPGGGIEPGESKEEALMRETLEETGLKIIPDSIKEYGYVLRKQKGKTEDVFIQENYYYFSQVEKKIESQSLEGYEALEKFVLEFVNPAEAIKTNRNINHGPKNQIMIESDAKLLELLMEEKLI